MTLHYFGKLLHNFGGWRVKVHFTT